MKRPNVTEGETPSSGRVQLRPQLSRHHLTEVPPHRPLNGPGELPQWGGAEPVPELGAAVVVTMNGLGPGVVVGYFIERGYLGLEVRCSNLPQWMLEQRARHGVAADAPAMVFGREFKKGIHVQGRPLPQKHGGKLVVDEVCRCGHRLSEHYDTISYGHGACSAPGCCSKFTWAAFVFVEEGAP